VNRDQIRDKKIINERPFHFLSLYRYCPLCGSSQFEVNGERSRRCHNCSFELYQNASAAVAAFIVDEQRGLLVCRRAKEPARGTLDLPGGFVDPDETLEQALDRELKEELGCRPASASYLFSLPNRYEWGDIVVPTTDCFFRCTLPEGASPMANDDVEAIRWMPFSEVRPADFGLRSVSQAVERFLSLSTTH